MTTKYLTAQNVQTITETFIDAAELDSTQEAIGDLLKDLKERLAKHSITFDSNSRLEAVEGITDLLRILVMNIRLLFTTLIMTKLSKMVWIQQDSRKFTERFISLSKM